jgi:tRNA modification GTPase
LNTNTICAISTPAGVGGIAVIRVSGSKAFEICDKILAHLNPPTRGKNLLSTQAANTVKRYNVTSPLVEGLGEALIDEVLVSVFHSPHSFTGENIVEIACHGSIFIQQEILKLLIANGCSLASAGEFTQRAFLNGKMDLSQAEAVADLIASTSASAHRIAVSQMRGNFSNELNNLRTQLLDFVSLIELELDFSEEDVTFADRAKLENLAREIEQKISRLENSFSLGNALKNGIPVAIVGQTNVGKSTLLNLLLNEDKAIVSDIHGTTRDTIEDTVNIAGVTFRFIDTAGIRQTADTIENLGIERTFKAIENAAIILWLIDCSEDFDKISQQISETKIKDYQQKIILVFNKIDKKSSAEVEKIAELFKNFDTEKIFISAKIGTNTEILTDLLLQKSQIPELQANDVVVSNIRHYEALQKAHNAIKRVIAGLTRNLSGDLLSQDIRETMHHLGEITGEISTDEVLGNIFSKFCIGK